MGWAIAALYGLVGGLALVAAFLLFWRLWFLRQPQRTIPERGIVSPGYGKLVRIVKFQNGEPQEVPKGLLGIVKTLTSDVSQSGWLLVIMLSPLDVHYQRAPVSGVVESVRYTRGKFANAVIGSGKLQAFENEKNEILINTGAERVKVVQVAGVAARRIVCSVSVGQRVEKGEVIGLINFGSQVLLAIPEGEILVHEGQRMVDGETVVAP